MKNNYDWPVVNFDEVVKISRGISYSSANLTEEGSGKPMLNLRNVGKGGGFRLDGLKYYDGEIKDRHRVFPGDLLIANTDLSKAKDVLGSPILVPTGFGYEEAVFSLDLTKLSIDRNKAIVKFVMYFLATPSTRNFMKDNGSGTTIMHLRLNSLSNLKIPLPPLKEQQNLVEMLDESFAEIDLLEKNLELSDEKANQLLQSILSTALNISQDSKGLRNHSANQRLTVKSVRLADIFRIGSSKRVLKADWKEFGVPFYRGREITRLSKTGFADNELFISESHFNDLSTNYGVPIPGDIMVTAIGTIGNTYIVKDSDRFYFKDASVLWLHKESPVDSQFIDYWLKSDLFFEQLDKGNGATVDTLTIEKLSNVKVQLPALDTQREIVARLDSSFAEIELLRLQIKREKDHASSLRQSLLSSAFTQQEVGV